MDRLLLATGNLGKITEMRESLGDLPLTLLTLRDCGDLPPPPLEGGTTFEQNAILKARFYHRATGLPTIADDSGLLVEALMHELGVHTRRWGAGPEASDAEWIAHFLTRMCRERNKRAEFVCILAYADDAGVRTFEGRCRGIVTDTLEAPYLPGLPISACFRPEGCDKVFSALTFEEKNRVSHRGRAIGKLWEFLRNIITPTHS